MTPEQKTFFLHRIEQNTFGHFCYLPQRLGFCVERTPDYIRIDAGFQSSMFNQVCGAPGFIEEAKVDACIDALIDAFQGRPFAWWLSPLSCSAPFKERLRARGFRQDTSEYAMVCDLTRWEAPGIPQTASVQWVEDAKKLSDFLKILSTYDEAAPKFYGHWHLPDPTSQEKLCVAYEDDEPVAIGLSYRDGDTAGIFSIITREDKRGRGYGTAVMVFLMEEAHRAGCLYSTLLASSQEGLRIYERLGFQTVGEFDCFEWSP